MFEVELPEGYQVPSTGLSKPAQKISKGARRIKEAAPSLGDIGRNVVRAGARIGEAALGAPADIATAALGLGSLAEQLIPQAPGQLPFFPTLHEKARKNLPTSENIRKYGTEKIAEKLLPEGYLTPQSEREQQIDSFVDLAAGLASPLTGPLKTGAKQALKLAGAGTFGGWAAKKLGAGEAGQALASGGAMLATTLAGRPRLIDKARSLYDVSKESAIKTPSNIGGKRIQEGVKKSLAEMDKGLENAAKNIARENIEQIRSKIDPVTGKIRLAEIAQIKKDINENIYKSSNVAEQKAANQYLKPVKDALLDTIKESEKTNPKFAKNLLEADQIWAALHEEGPITQFMQKWVKMDVNDIKSPLTVGILTTLGGTAVEPFFPTVGQYVRGAGLGLTAFSAANAGRIFMKSPVARKYYGELIGAALKQNVPATLKAIRKLDDIFVAEDESGESLHGGSFEIELP